MQQQQQHATALKRLSVVRDVASDPDMAGEETCTGQRGSSSSSSGVSKLLNRLQLVLLAMKCADLAGEACRKHAAAASAAAEVAAVAAALQHDAAVPLIAAHAAPHRDMAGEPVGAAAVDATWALFSPADYTAARGSIQVLVVEDSGVLGGSALVSQQQQAYGMVWLTC
jgi:hypothetical protein